MRRIGLLIAIVGSLLCKKDCVAQTDFAERDRLFNDGWFFMRGNEASANDSDWTKVCLPHDYSLMSLGTEDNDSVIGPFTKSSYGGNHTGFVAGGIGWYRKSFSIAKKDIGKRFTLLFDGAYMETDVWVNQQYVGANKNGYTPFAFDITPYLKPSGQKNTITIRTDNYGRNSRWYSGSGLYRDVKMIVTNPLHIGLWGIFARTLEATTDKAHVQLEVSLHNDGNSCANAEVELCIKDKNGLIVAWHDETMQVSANQNLSIVKNFTIKNPQLWDLHSPALYYAVVNISKDGQPVDRYVQPFGVRTLSFSSEQGFLLNGKPVLLQGACLHHDNGLLGAMAIRRAEYRRVELMKRNGYNAIRCSHNPPSSSFLQACDEIGMLVIDEFTDMWNYYKNPDDYARFFNDHWENNLTNMIMRDRNHPSIILWSIGNEIPKANIKEGSRTGQMLADKVRLLDPSRGVTEGVPSFLIHGGWKNTADYFATLDVCGYNYTQKHYENDHILYPNRVMYASEAYPKEAYYGWKQVEQYPYVVGEFVWTALDYIGEVGLGDSHYVDKVDTRSMQDRDGIPEGTPPTMVFDMMQKYSQSKWPMYLSGCGDLDIIGEKKAQGKYRDVLWKRTPLEMVVHEPKPQGKVESVTAWGWPRERSSWTWPGCEDDTLQVRVFTEAEEVRLEINGVSVGHHRMKETDELIASFDVPYVSGNLTAIAMKDGKELARNSLYTTGTPFAIRLSADRDTVYADTHDLAFIRIDVVDKNGNIVPYADDRVAVNISGEAQIVASGNANPYGMKDINRSSFHVYQGQAQLIVRPTGKEGNASVKVSNPNLGEAVLHITMNQKEP